MVSIKVSKLVHKLKLRDEIKKSLTGEFMEKWQLAGIISSNRRTKLILPKENLRAPADQSPAPLKRFMNILKDSFEKLGQRGDHS